MASLPLLLLFLLSFSFLTNPTNGLNCSSQTFSNNRIFNSCNDLPHLNSSLYWTLNPSKPSLNLVFVAPPSKSNGWIAWAINPTSNGMIGAQSLIAFRQSNGSMTVQTFDIRSYGSIKPSKISIEVSNLEGEFSDGVMRIFATVVIPENLTRVNQVWQVGSSVTEGIPDTHDLGEENLKSMGMIDLLEGQKLIQHSNGMMSGGGSSTSSSSSSSPLLFSRILILFLAIFVVGILVILWNV